MVRSEAAAVTGSSCVSYPIEVKTKVAGSCGTVIRNAPLPSVNVPEVPPCTTTETAGTPSPVALLRTVPESVVDWAIEKREKSVDSRSSNAHRSFLITEIYAL
jgi:hypothetical protein